MTPNWGTRQYIEGQGSNPVRSREARGMGQQEPHEMQQGQSQVLPLLKDTAWGLPVLWEVTCGPWQIQTEHKPVVCPGCRDGQRCPGRYLQAYSQNTEGRDYPLPLVIHEIPSEILHPVLSPSIEERNWWMSSAEGTGWGL